MGDSSCSRSKAVYSGLTLAEYLRDEKNQDVLLFIDNIYRFIQAQSEKYEQLGYFKAILRTKGILTPDTITSSPGEKSENLVKATIEGDMP